MIIGGKEKNNLEIKRNGIDIWKRESRKRSKTKERVIETIWGSGKRRYAKRIWAGFVEAIILDEEAWDGRRKASWIRKETRRRKEKRRIK